MNSEMKPQVVKPFYKTMCAGCADKLERTADGRGNRKYNLLELTEEPGPGQCPMCFCYSHLSRYRVLPLKPTYKPRTGGGERERARR